MTHDPNTITIINEINSLISTDCRAELKSINGFSGSQVPMKSEDDYANRGF